MQQIANRLTADTYETHARVALEMSDFSEFNQCQSKLRGLYADAQRGKAPSAVLSNHLEFTAYFIIYGCLTKQEEHANRLVAATSAADRKHECVQHALGVRRAVANDNYRRFFRLHEDAPRPARHGRPRAPKARRRPPAP